MGGRYLRTFECEDCGEQVTRMWQGGRARVCLACGIVRHDVATRAAHHALEAHKRACRLELMVRRALEEAQRPASPVRPAALFGGGAESTSEPLPSP